MTVSLQVLEHIWTPGDYVRELARVTRPGGVVVLSTPNRLTFSPGLGRREKPSNLYHCREYDAEELAGELGRWLPGAEVTVLGPWPRRAAARLGGRARVGRGGPAGPGPGGLGRGPARRRRVRDGRRLRPRRPGRRLPRPLRRGAAVALPVLWQSRQPSSVARRPDLSWPLRFLLSIRRRWDPLVGRVGRRCGGSGAAASRSRVTSR